MVGRSGDAGIWSVFEKKRVIVTRRPGGLQRRGIVAGARSGTRASGGRGRGPAARPPRCAFSGRPARAARAANRGRGACSR
ncbi:GlcG protein [Burkholderia pseudomallei 305]|nr:GlcG protein [Burkholderia pseudomallei 305]